MGALGVVMHHQPIRHAGILVLFDLARERNRPSLVHLSYFTPWVGRLSFRTYYVSARSR